MAHEEARGIVTPEAVVLEFETAGVGSRGLPAIVDLTIQLGVIMALLFALVFISGPLGSARTAGVIISLFMVFGVLFGYPIVMEMFWRGRTVGKAMVGLRVLTKEGAPIRFRHAAIRSFSRVFELIVFFGAPAITACILSRDNQRIGDFIAGTIVVREKSGDPMAFPVTFPPPYGYESYVASLDVSGLDTVQYGVVRSFLLRVRDLTPGARSLLAVRLANPVALRLSHTPPPMVDPELFLGCVAAAYQLRHGGGVAQAAPSPVAEQGWAAAQTHSGWTGTPPAWPGAGPASGPSTPPPPPPPPPTSSNPTAGGTAVPPGGTWAAGPSAPAGPPPIHAPGSSPAPAAPFGPATELEGEDLPDEGWDPFKRQPRDP